MTNLYFVRIQVFATHKMSSYLCARSKDFDQTRQITTIKNFDPLRESIINLKRLQGTILK